jgi:hypothetical protein
LDIYCTTHCIDDADEFHENTIACGLYDPAAVLSDFWIDQVLAVRLETSMRAFLIRAHEAAVTGNIGCQDRCEPAVNTIFGHTSPAGLLPVSIELFSGLEKLPRCDCIILLLVRHVQSFFRRNSSSKILSSNGRARIHTLPYC